MKGLLFRKQPRNGRRLSAFRNRESVSNFVVILPNVSEKDVKGLLFRQRAALTFRNWQSILNFDVSLPNVSEKDVKGLLFRKQPRTGGGFQLLGIGKAVQTLMLAFRTQVKDVRGLLSRQ